jgi:hypothetical protein
MPAITPEVELRVSVAPWAGPAVVEVIVDVSGFSQVELSET